MITPRIDGFQQIPVAVVRLGDRDEVGAEEDAGHAVDGEQAVGQRRPGRGILGPT